MLFDRRGRLLIYLRDNRSDIPFPNCWDFFGGHVEDGETPAEALVRETKEELGIDLSDWNYFRTYVCIEGDVYPNIKFMYWARIEKSPEDLVLYEGQKLASIILEERHQFVFANILGAILDDFVDAGLWPRPVNND